MIPDQEKTGDKGGKKTVLNILIMFCMLCGLISGSCSQVTAMSSVEQMVPQKSSIPSAI